MTQLPDDINEPLVLADGTKIDPSTGSVIKERKAKKYVEVPSHSSAVKQITAVRTRIADLPTPPRQMNVIGVICFYSMMGMTDIDIATVTNLSTDQIARIKEGDTYVEAVNMLQEALRKEVEQDVRGLLSAHATAAAQVQIDTLSSDDEKAALSASNSILDRAGHRPVDVVEHRHQLEGELTIHYVKQEANDDRMNIDLTLED